MTKIQIISGSSREGRGTPKVAHWVLETAKSTQPNTDFELVDLADYDLPFMTEAIPPMGNQNRQLSDAAKAWTEKLGEADGFVFVTPEYNHSIPAVLKNAIDTLDFQLMKKPVAVVSHGAIGGARANEHLRLIVNSNLGAVPVPNSVTVKGGVAWGGVFNENGKLDEANQDLQKPLEEMLEATVWYTEALKAKREV